MTNKLIYIHDPMCSWCWGFSETYQRLLKALPSEMIILRLLGGLAADSNEPMNELTKSMVQNSWKRIEQTIPNKKFNFDFWTNNIPRRSTYPACRAVIAARNQDLAYDEIMTQTIQQAYYTQAKNPSDDTVLIELAKTIGLNIDTFIQDLNSQQTYQQLQEEIKQCRSMNVDSFPSLVLKTAQQSFLIPIDYLNEQAILETINELYD